MADGVVDLVRTGVEQVLALQVDRAAALLRQALGEVERRRAPGVKDAAKIAAFIKQARGTGL